MSRAEREDREELERLRAIYRACRKRWSGHVGMYTENYAPRLVAEHAAWLEKQGVDGCKACGGFGLVTDHYTQHYRPCDSCSPRRRPAGKAVK